MSPVQKDREDSIKVLKISTITQLTAELNEDKLTIMHRPGGGMLLLARYRGA